MGTDERSILSLCFGQWEANAVVLIDRARATAAVVDPGQGADDVLPPLLAALGVELEAVLLTHGHLDHLWAAPALARMTDAEVLLHPADRWLWDAPAAAFGAPPSALAAYGLHWETAGVEPKAIDHRQRLMVAGFDIETVHTPGHTPGHVIYLASGIADIPVGVVDVRVDTLPTSTATMHVLAAVDEAGAGDEDGGASGIGAGVHRSVASEELMVSGDLLFAGSIGRTDLAQGSFEDIMESVAHVMHRCDDAMLVIPGHGPLTTVGNERRTNPYVAQALRQHGGPESTDGQHGRR
ncbi:MAG: MBL fold metallo-hydrolase [Nitriliruptoraceae bacterium]